MPDGKPGDVAAAIALKQKGADYVYNTAGPKTFDCSGLIYWSYYLAPDSPGINVGRDTNAQWSSPRMETIYDYVAKQASGENNVFDPNQLEVGDVILYFQPGNSGANAHVKMYIGGGQTIEAPHTGDVVKVAKVDLVGSRSEPIRGIRRVTGGGSPGGSAAGGDGSSDGSGGGNASSQTGAGVGGTPSDTTGSVWQKEAASLQTIIANLPDPINNLPFSAYFMGQQTAGSDSGTVRWQFPGQGGSLSSSQLVRGAMGEMAAKRFKCFFMMNPAQINVGVGIDSSNLSPSQQDPDFAQSGGYWVSNQTVSFTLIFNRMYEVWQGNVPGPSDIGCRWDIRALERLVGIFDAVADKGGNVGLGNFGWGSSPAMTIPLQVVFGGANSMQFQGILSSLSYTFTMFDKNMIPVEATADLEIMRVYQPDQSGADLVQTLQTQTGQAGPQESHIGIGGVVVPFTVK